MTNNTKLIEDFLRDPNLEKALNYNKNYNAYSITELSETRVSSILAWLLNPNEGHNLGSKFLMELLKNSVNSKNELVLYDEKEPNPYPLQEFLSWEFDKNTLVFKEFETGKGRIDIAIFNKEMEVAIFIENKYNDNSKEGEKQTKKYYDALNKKYKNHVKLFVYLDYNMNEKPLSDNEHWVKLDYDWIERFLKNQLERGNLPKDSWQIVKDFYEDYSEDLSFTSSFNGCENAIKKLAQKHEELVKIIEPVRYEHEKYLDINVSDKKTLKEKDNEIIEETKLYDLYFNHQDIFEAMSGFGEFANIEEELKKKLGNSKSFDLKDSGIYFTSKIMDKASGDDYWFAEIGCFKKFEKDSNGKDLKEKYYLRAYIDTTKLNDITKIRKMLISNKDLSVKGRKYLRFSKKCWLNGIEKEDIEKKNITEELLSLEVKMRPIFAKIEDLIKKES